MKQIWAKDIREEMNVKLDFSLCVDASASTVLRVASDVPFRITVDGKLFGYGPRRMAFGHAAINEYSLSCFSGQKVLVKVECVSYYCRCFYIQKQTPFFAAEVLENGKVVFDSFDFTAERDERKIQRVQRYAYQRGFAEAYDFSRGTSAVETDELTVCKLCSSTVPYVDFLEYPFTEIESGQMLKKDTPCDWDDSRFNRHGSDCFAPSEQELRVTAFGESYAAIKGKVSSDTLSSEYKLYSLENEYTGFVAFSAETGKDGAEILITYDECILPAKGSFEKFHGEDGKVDGYSYDNTDNFRNGALCLDTHRINTLGTAYFKLTPGNHDIVLFEPESMKYMRIAVLSGSAKIANVRLVSYELSVPAYKWVSDDPELTLMYESAVRTLRPNSVDVLTDCASRERTGWLCDSFFSGRAERAITGQNAIERNLIRAFLDRNNDDGIPPQIFPMCYPADHSHHPVYIPNWCMWLVLEIANYAKANKGDDIVDAIKQKVLDYVDFTLGFINEEGLLENLDSWIFVEWSRCNSLVSPISFPTNMLFSATLKAVTETYGIAKYAEIADKIDKAVMKYSKRGMFFMDQGLREDGKIVAYEGEYTETCQYYAFYFGYASKQTDPQLYNLMFEEICSGKSVKDRFPLMSRSDSFIGLYVKIDYLHKIGEYPTLIKNLKNYFLHQTSATGTFWEYSRPQASCCHAFAAIVAEWLIASPYGKIVGKSRT